MTRPQIPGLTRRTVVERPLTMLERATWYAAGRVPPTLSRKADLWPRLEEPESPTPPLRVIIRSFREGELLATLIRYCWNQGADRIVVLDDLSQDGSVVAARNEGAEVREAPPTIDDREERGLAWVMATLEEDPSDAWWLVLDADEFPMAPAGATLAQFLRTVPSDVDLVGSHALEHFPQPAGESTFDALVARRSGAGVRWTPLAFCPRAHFKHNLIRRRPEDPLRWAPGGFHWVQSRRTGERPREAAVPLLLHHLRWHDLDAKLQYLSQVLSDPRRTHREKEIQMRNIRWVQRGRWDRHQDAKPTSRRWGVRLEPWPSAAYAWTPQLELGNRILRAAVWGGSVTWRERILGIADTCTRLIVADPPMPPDPSQTDLVLVPTPEIAAALNERCRRETDAGVWVMPETWSDDGLARLLEGAIMDASAGAAPTSGSPLDEMRFQLQRVFREPAEIAKKARSCSRVWSGTRQ